VLFQLPCVSASARTNCACVCACPAPTAPSRSKRHTSALTRAGQRWPHCCWSCGAVRNWDVVKISPGGALYWVWLPTRVVTAEKNTGYLTPKNVGFNDAVSPAATSYGGGEVLSKRWVQRNLSLDTRPPGGSWGRPDAQLRVSLAVCGKEQHVSRPRFRCVGFCSCLGIRRHRAAAGVVCRAAQTRGTSPVGSCPQAAPQLVDSTCVTCRLGSTEVVQQVLRRAPPVGVRQGRAVSTLCGVCSRAGLVMSARGRGATPSPTYRAVTLGGNAPGTDLDPLQCRRTGYGLSKRKRDAVGKTSVCAISFGV
jgi:hypothetical protein